MKITRRIGLTALAGSAVTLLAACRKSWTLDPQDLSMRGSLPDLAFRMTEAETGRTVTEADFRGKVVVVYFGYTNCPNVCPLTLYEITRILASLGPKADAIRILFVTVDPERDTLAVLKRYVALFHAPELVGLRGTSTELHDFASRYRAAYSVHPSPVPADYAVTHTAACFVFNRQGKAEFLCAGLSAQKPDLGGIARDLRHLTDTGTV